MDMENIKLGDNGLVPVVVQDYLTKKLLMLAYANTEALQLSVKTGYAHYYSRSRQQLWKKGETSGNVQEIKRISYDCDKDAVLYEVIQHGVACHTGEASCFHNTVYEAEELPAGIDEIIKEYEVILDRKENPKEGSYTNYLLSKGMDRIAKKVGEEATEVVIAGKNADKAEICYETADLFYHLFVLLAHQGITLYDICEELRKRR